MTPFRTKKVKQDRDVSNFKFDILHHRVVEKPESMPKYFLSDCPKQAEEVYKKYEKILNSLAYNYSLSTGIDRADLFGEALIGLARAKRDWDPKRSDNFKSYAIYRIKDSLNECARKNRASISVPAYIKKANVNLKELEDLCERSDIELHTILLDHEIPYKLDENDAIRAAEIINNLINAANRSRVNYDKFVERIRYIPTDVPYEEDNIETSNRDQEKLEAAIVVAGIKKMMTKEELSICDGVMKDLSYEEIGKTMGKSKAWVSNKLRVLRERIVDNYDGHDV
jgi:RNA polymerase sigma factor (sigma-70 family)